MPHWNDLREAIKERGLWHLVSKNGEEAIKSVTNQIEGKEHHYDPLMAGNFAIWSNALDAGGLYLMGKDENGNEYCPLCELDKHTNCDPKASVKWITGCADEQLKICQEKGLVSS